MTNTRILGRAIGPSARAKDVLDMQMARGGEQSRGWKKHENLPSQASIEAALEIP